MTVELTEDDLLLMWSSLFVSASIADDGSEIFDRLQALALKIDAAITRVEH